MPVLPTAMVTIARSLNTWWHAFELKSKQTHFHRDYDYVHATSFHICNKPVIV
jgi:hypothetical protein